MPPIKMKQLGEESLIAMQTLRCDRRYAEEIRTIFNEAILHSTSLYDYKPRTEAMIHEWFAAKDRAGYPVIGVVDPEGGLLGFGSFGQFRAFPAYKYSMEHSLYVANRFRGLGVGRKLLQEIIDCAISQGYHTLIGGIDSENTVSKELHRTFGFTHVGTIREAGFKFGRWLHLEFHQLLLPTPAEPQDG